MGSTDTFTTGAAGAAPSPAVVVRPSRCVGWVAVAPAAAPAQGTGLSSAGAFGGMRPATPVVRPWDGPLTREPGRAVLQHATEPTGLAAVSSGYAQRIASTAPGAEPPRDPLS